MNETLYLLFAFTAGLFLGTLFFCGLWLTVKQMVASKTPALLFIGSFFLRLSIALLGFYYIADGSLQRLLLCVLGFVTARFMVVRLTRSNGEKQILVEKEADHEA